MEEVFGSKEALLPKLLRPRGKVKKREGKKKSCPRPSRKRQLMTGEKKQVKVTQTKPGVLLNGTPIKFHTGDNRDSTPRVFVKNVG